jgi:hypothetical protein
MARLHELLAVEGDLAGTYQKIMAETKVNFTKHPDRYFGQHQRIEPFSDDIPKEADTYKEMDDTVPAKLDYTAEHIIRYLDVVLQKETTNQSAISDLVIDGVTIAKDLPATFLLGLESKLKKIREDVYASIPTLQPGVKWEEDETIGKGVFKRTYPEEKFRTRKVMKNHVVAEATKEHPAQVQVYTEDEKIGRIVTNTWCGMISSAEKSAILGRIDKLIRAVKKARQQANSTEVVKVTVGKEIFNYINS